MKKLIIFLCLALFAFAVHAQLAAGLKLGLKTSKISTKVADYTPQTVNNYQLGAYARVGFGSLYLQPEVYFNTRGGEYINRITPSVVNSFDLNTVDVPALLGIKIVNQEALNVRAMAGPVFSFLASKSVRGQINRNTLENSFFGWQYGVGIDFLFLTFDIRKETYGKNFCPDFNTKNGTFLISLGVKLF